MQFNKSYKLLRFLNREHGWVSCHAFAAAGWLGTMTATRSVTLANGLAREFRRDQYDIACRKAARYARHLSSRLDLFNDLFFDFTKNTTASERRALQQWAERHRQRLSRVDYLTDRLYIIAADIHARLSRGDAAQDAIDQFHSLASLAVQTIDEMPAGAEAKSATKGIEASRGETSFDKAEAAQALRDIAVLLPLDQWPWYVASGTLLGLHREGDFLAHDLDIDLGINADEVDVGRLVATISQARGFTLKATEHNLKIVGEDQDTRSLIKRPAILKVIHDNGLQIDFFICYKEEGALWHGSTIHWWWNTPFSLNRRTLAGVEVNAPDDANRYLTECYGDWRTPRTSFDCSTHTPNLALARNYLSPAHAIKRYAWLKQRDAKQAATVSRMLSEASVLVEAHVSMDQAGHDWPVAVEGRRS